MSTLRTAPAILAIVMTTAVGAATGSLVGGFGFVVAGAVVGALWGAGLALLAGRLGRSPASRTWTDATLFATILCLGCVTGAGLASQLVFDATLDHRPELFAALVRGDIGTAQALPFYIFNSPLEWILIPAAVVLTWNNPRRRGLILAVLIMWTFHRVWTYVYFVPEIAGWGEGDPGTPLSNDQLDQARTWIDLTWIRSAIDIVATVLALLAAFRPVTSDEPARAVAKGAAS